MTRKNPELIAAVESLKSTLALLVEDMALTVGNVEQIRNNTHEIRTSLQTIVNEQGEISAHIAELRTYQGKLSDSVGAIDARLTLIQDQMIEGFRKLGADLREVRAEGKNSGRERLETR